MTVIGTKRGAYAKVNVWLGEELAREVASEAKRLDRSQGWVMKRCIRLASKQLSELPTVPSVPTGPTTGPTTQP